MNDMLFVSVGVLSVLFILCIGMILMEITR